jgi:hypothetical protein
MAFARAVTAGYRFLWLRAKASVLRRAPQACALLKASLSMKADATTLPHGLPA